MKYYLNMFFAICLLFNNEIEAIRDTIKINKDELHSITKSPIGGDYEVANAPCPQIITFTNVILSPNPCTNIEYNLGISINGNQTTTVIFNFGDGSPNVTNTIGSSGFAGTHVFNSAGIYTLTATLIGTGNCTTTATQTVYALAESE